MIKLKNSNCDKTLKKTQIVMKFNNSNCDETQTEMVTKLKKKLKL